MNIVYHFGDEIIIKMSLVLYCDDKQLKKFQYIYERITVHSNRVVKFCFSSFTIDQDMIYRKRIRIFNQIGNTGSAIFEDYCRHTMSKLVIY